VSGRTPDEGRYSKVTRRMWNDSKFRELSAPKPNAQSLWFRLLTGPELGIIPGLFAAREAGLADALDWPLPAFRKCWKEIESRGMASADWKAGVVWVPNSIRHNEPTSPNSVASWRRAANELPECPLRTQAFESLAAYLESMGALWIGAWQLALGSASTPAKIREHVRDAVRERDGDNCRYCGIIANWNDRKGPTGATYDHVDPTGPASLDNIVVACRACNSKKGFKTPTMAGLVLLQVQSGADLDQNLDPDLNPFDTQEQDSGAGLKKQEQKISEPPAASPDSEFQDKCRIWLRSPATASIEGASQHPKIRQIAEAWCRPFGVASVKMTDNPSKSSDLAAIVQAFAAGYSEQELLHVAELAPGDAFIQEIARGGGGGPSVFSLKVIDGILRPGTIRRRRPRSDEASGPEPVDPKLEAAAQQRLAREAERQRLEIEEQTRQARAELIARGIDPDSGVMPSIAALTARIG